MYSAGHISELAQLGMIPQAKYELQKGAILFLLICILLWLRKSKHKNKPRKKNCDLYLTPAETMH